MDGSPVDGHELVGLLPAAQAYRDIVGLPNPYRQYDHIFGTYHDWFCYGPLSFLVVVLFYLLFGLQGQMVMMVNVIYIFAMLLATYGIGKHIFNAPIGFLAAFILSSFQGIIYYSRQYWVEFGLIAYVCLDLYLLLKTNFFQNRKYSILLGISLALSLLHKYEFIVFIWGPLLLVIYKSDILKNLIKIKWSRSATNFILMLIVATILTSWWLFPYGNRILTRLSFVLTHEHEIASQEKNYSLHEMITYYLKSINSLTGNVFFAMFLIVTIFLIVPKIAKKSDKRFYIMFLMLWFLFSYIVFTIAREKGQSHILSLLPCIAIFISAGVYFIKTRISRITLIILIILHGLVLHLYAFCSLRHPYLFFPQKVYTALDNILVSKLKWDYGTYCHPHFYAPQKEPMELEIKEILQFINKDAKEKRKEYPEVIVLPMRQQFKNSIFEYYNLIGNYRLKFPAEYMMIEDISKVEYIVAEDLHRKSIAELINRSYTYEVTLEHFDKLFKDELSKFELIKTYPLADRVMQIYIFRRT